MVNRVEIVPFDPEIQNCSLLAGKLTGEVARLLENGEPYDYPVVYYPQTNDNESKVIDFGPRAKTEHGEGSFCSFSVPRREEGDEGTKIGIGFRVGNGVVPLFVTYTPPDPEITACRFVYPINTGASNHASEWAELVTTTSQDERAAYAMDEDRLVPTAKVLDSLISILSPNYRPDSEVFTFEELYRVMEVDKLVEDSGLAADIAALRIEQEDSPRERSELNYREAMRIAQQDLVNTCSTGKPENITLVSDTLEPNGKYQRTVDIVLTVSPDGSVSINQIRTFANHPAANNTIRLGWLHNGEIHPDTGLTTEQQKSARSAEPDIAEKLGVEVRYLIDPAELKETAKEHIERLKKENPGAIIHLDFGDQLIDPSYLDDSYIYEGVVFSGKLGPSFSEGIYCEFSIEDRDKGKHLRRFTLLSATATRAKINREYPKISPVGKRLKYAVTEGEPYTLTSHRIPPQNTGKLHPSAFGIAESEAMFYNLSFTDPKLKAPVSVDIYGGKVLRVLTDRRSRSYYEKTARVVPSIRDKKRLGVNVENIFKTIEDAFGGPEQLAKYTNYVVSPYPDSPQSSWLRFPKSMPKHSHKIRASLATAISVVGTESLLQPTARDTILSAVGAVVLSLVGGDVAKYKWRKRQTDSARLLEKAQKQANRQSRRNDAAGA